MIYQEMLTKVIEKLQSQPDYGLTKEQVVQSRQANGDNQFVEPPKEGLIKRVLRSLSDITTIILIIAAIISLITTVIQGHGDYFESFLIIAIVVINSVLSIVQEGRAEKALDSLKGLEREEAKVRRDGDIQFIPMTDIVVGDILVLENGVKIPADARLLKTADLRVEESPLTGESHPIEKDEDFITGEQVPLGDRRNMVYRGTTIVNGRGEALVVATGMNTEMGKIASLLGREEREMTPMQKRLAQLGRQLTVVAIIAAIIVMILGIMQGDPLMELFMTAVSLAVAVVPETLMVIVTITLALGVQRMAARHAIVRRLPAVETLGSASVIASDKTGTLTQNKMTARQVWDATTDTIMAVDEAEALPDALKFGALSTNVTEQDGTLAGLPTEMALVGGVGGYSAYEALQAEYPKVYEIPFNSTRKRMTTVHRVADGYLAITKGAFDVLLPKLPLDLQERAKAVNQTFGDQALRVITVAITKLPTLSAEPTAEELEQNLQLLGLVGIIDPPRPESAQAVAEAREAGIKTVMITGDHVATASAIAKEIGILLPTDKALTGAELHDMSDAELDDTVQDYAVYARVTPEDKIRIVKAWQKRGDIVAMTGDGVNDAPALNAANVGIAMGQTGTDVAREAADIVLTDDNFATIVHAVEEGRGIYGNIRKTINFLMSANMSEIIVIVVAMILGWGSPLMAAQLLFINLVADGLPGFALAKEPPHGDVMRDKPVNPRASVFAHGLGLRIAFNAILFALITLAAQGYGVYTDNNSAGHTMAFIVLSISSILHVFNIRSDASMFRVKFSANRSLVMMALLSLVLTILVVTVPVTQDIFHFMPLTVGQWLLTIILSIIPNIIWEVIKMNNRKIQ
ncbi:cation-translocating P-type ATPase [Weissella cibaria]|uniref:cation-translocating P-type ATPase n=1 Tax=Weissella cibaria TaxID=137591 RepID=UPI00223A774D|nr:cation-translocating P-type ATPase [Weissella cibaria]MCT0021675.1 cation-translocating P-type ATPase [Weissella cibaria]